MVQEGKEVIFENNLIQWGFDGTLMGAYKDSFEKDNNFKANIAGVGSLSWTSLPENIALDKNAKKSQVIGGTGQPYITGAWPGDYWEFSVPLKNVPAGNVVTFTALHRMAAGDRSGNRHERPVHAHCSDERHRDQRVLQASAGGCRRYAPDSLYLRSQLAG